MAVALYAGPGKVFINSIALQPEGENGPIRVVINEDSPEIATAMFGKMGYQLANQEAEITTKPFDNWGSLPTLFPAYVGAKQGATAAALLIGTRPHNATVGAGTGCKVWTPDGRLYNFVRSAVVGHPSLHLGVGKALFGDCKIAAIGDLAVTLGSSAFLVAASAITESAAADPGGAMTMADFVRGAWTGVWGTVAGFGGAAGSLGGTNAVQAEDEWTIETEIKYSPLKVQGLTKAMKLDSVAYMAKCKPYGPSHTDIVAALSAHTQGGRLGSADLTLTGPSSKTITLKNAEIRGAGFEFGGTTLGTGEVGFVNFATFTTGAVNSLIEFSA